MNAAESIKSDVKEAMGRRRETGTNNELTAKPFPREILAVPHF